MATFISKAACSTSLEKLIFNINLEVRLEKQDFFVELLVKFDNLLQQNCSPCVHVCNN